MYLKAINATLAAWVVGLFADANIRLGDPQGFLCLRGLLPVLAMGLCILSELKKKLGTANCSESNSCPIRWGCRLIFMVGMILWEPIGHWSRSVTLKEVSVLHIRFLCARMAQDRRRNPLTERRRLRTAGKKLLRQRVEQVVLPAGASAEALPEGLRPVETLPLRRAIAADWCGELLRFRGENPAGARVLITADALSGEVVERQFYIKIWDRAVDGVERDLLQKLKYLSGYFADCGIQSEILEQQDIVRLCNLVNNPAYVHLEDAEFEAAIPILESVGVV